MATVLEPTPRSPAPERIRHPLQAVRATIRKYVVLESAALAVSFLAAWFWIGMALDWGMFAIFSYDWVLELQHLDESKKVAFYVRLVILLAVLACLAALVITKMVLRLTKEFSDAAVALVLERRFPRELGDRLITAVEMADPQEAAKLGYSRQMIDKTVQDAGERVEKLPVDEVFDWARLKKQWFQAGLLTLGMFLSVGAATCGLNAATGGSASPMAFLGNFTDTSAIWTERNVFLMDSYWPRRAYLEIVRFQDTPSHPGEMRVGRDEQRPELLVRAVQWVVADRQAPDGWRALRWSDLSNYLPKDLLDKVAIPAEFPGWLVDLDDLDAEVASNVLPADWQGKTTGVVRQQMQTEKMQALLHNSIPKQAVDALLDWHSWSVDKIKLQEEKPEVRQPLREQHLEAHKALEEVFSRLEEMAASSSMSRRLRKLTIPSSVEIVYRGEETKTTQPADARADHKFTVDLNELKESVRFRMHGEDYWTKPLKITLVPPPSVVEVRVDKEEPAYLYHRLQGKQEPLKGKKQLFADFKVSATGDTTTIDIPFGSHLTLKAKVDRPLQDGIRIRPPGGAGAKDSGAAVPDSPVLRDADGLGYSARFENIVKMLEFNVEYFDQDNVKGRRRFRIRPIDDQPPEIISPELMYVLRKPRFKTEPGKTGGGLSIDGYLITPDALLPFNGTLRDDYGLTKAEWLFETELVDLQLAGTESGGVKDRSGFLLTQGKPGVRRGGLIASALQYHPASLQPAATTAYWAWVAHLFDAAAKQQSGGAEEAVAMDGFLKRMDERSIDEIPLAALADLLQQKPTSRPRLKEHQLKDEDGFDLRRHLARLKPKDPLKETQQLYFLKVAIAATDNNVETGPSTSRTKAPFFFLVVSENDLLAQVAAEEEVLSERLEKVMDKLSNARVSINEQMGKLPQGGDLSLVAIRADEIRKAVLDGASVTREVHADYSRILKELEVNRVRRAKIDEVRSKIVLPLEEIINPNFGEFQMAEDASHKFYQALDDDVTAKRTPNLDAHLGNARQTRDQLEKLMARLNDVLIAMGEGIIEARNFENLVLITRNQEEITKQFNKYHTDKVREILNQILPDMK